MRAGAVRAHSRNGARAVKNAAGRERVVELLKQIENAEEHAKLRGEAFCEFGWLWEKLGIDRNG